MALRVENLTVKSQNFPVVDGLSFHVSPRQTLALVGESGCGKTVTALSVMGLLPAGLKVAGGEIALGGERLTGLSPKELGKRRGKLMSMIFQEPMTALNPVMTIGRQITETIEAHKARGKRESKAYALDLLREVGLEAAEKIFRSYPHELSGGMRQRVMCVIAICASPKLIIADEPTTALDATIQAQILELLGRLKEKSGAAILLITHNLLAASILADRLAVLYAGSLVETGPASLVLRQPVHPYTRALMGSQPALRLGREALSGAGRELSAIPGQVPPPGKRPPGCAFAGRCPYGQKSCLENKPPMVQKGPDHFGACFLDS